jgi:hypothetical protein
MKAILGLLGCLLLLSPAQGQVVFYRQHIVLSGTSGNHSRSVQSGWLLVDIPTSEIAIVAVNKKTREFTIELARSDSSVEQFGNKSITVRNISQGSLSGLIMRGLNKPITDVAPLSPKVSHVTGANGEFKFHGNLVLDKGATVNASGAPPNQALQGLKDLLTTTGYTQR